MKLLTRAEELILLAIWKLGEDAYCVPVRKLISEITEENWSLGTIYMPLERLEKRGFVKSALSDSTPKRGGRHKRIYTLLPEGVEALKKVREVEMKMWSAVSDMVEETS